MLQKGFRIFFLSYLLYRYRYILFTLESVLIAMFVLHVQHKVTHHVFKN